VTTEGKLPGSLLSDLAAAEAVDRRAFLLALASAMGCAKMGMSSSSGPTRIPRLGLQLYTVRGEMQKDIERTLARVAEIGYKEVEFAGYFGKTPREIRAILDKNGLTSPSVHVPVDQILGNMPTVVDAAKTIGHEYLIMPWLDAKTMKSAADWKSLAGQLNKAGEAAQSAGLKFGYHNHDFEFQPIEGQLPFDILLNNTDPKLVVVELDLYWITKAGYDPLAYFAKWPGRTHLVHVKDGGAKPEFRMTPVGQGTIDWKRIFVQSGQAGIRHYFVEHDSAAEGGADPFVSIRTSFDYLSKLEF
jgi:sugar phosphate isomerase/epimerase